MTPRERAHQVCKALEEMASARLTDGNIAMIEGDIVAALDEEREACAYEGALEMQRGADAKNPGRVLAAMNIKNAIRARGGK